MTQPGLILSQQMKMQQVLAPHLFQSLEILQMPLLDLQQLIKQELAENPTLEAKIDQPDEHIEIEPGTADLEREEFDNEFEKLAALGEEWRDDFYRNRPLSSPDEAEEKHQFLLDSLSESSSLHDVLLEQLALSGLDDYEKKIAEIVIGSIDDDGYLRLDVDELLALPNFPRETLDKIIATIQTFDPPGVGARDLRECLLLQLERKGKKDTPLYRLVADHLDLLARHKYEEIARAMDLPVEEVHRLAEEVSRLDPKPGRNFDSRPVEYVIPEVFVEKNEDGEYVVTLNRRPYPRLYISPRYLDMLKDPEIPKEVKAYIREKIAKSKQFIQSIDQRMNTIYRIAEEIVRIQRDFFDHGVTHLKPLNMKTIAERLGIHETTVSRAISGKYMQTPRGLFSMKYFFTPGVKTTDGRLVSNESVKAVLRELIENEDKRRPLSDTRLAKLLEERGIKIARRTVAKYRDQMRILPSHLRRRR